MTLNINLTRRIRRRKLKDGSVVEQTRYVLNWRDPEPASASSGSSNASGTPRSGARELLAAYERGVYSSHPKP